MSFGLYRTFKSNFIPYYANGGGRDKYILYDNAGFFHNPQKALSPSNIYRTGTFLGTKIIKNKITPSIKAPTFHYHANGSGRDRYILSNGGGLYSDSKPLSSFKLSDFLRKNENNNMNNNIPPIKRSRIYLSRNEIIHNKLLRNKEKDIVRRLYENEKKKFLKKNKTDLFSFENIEENNRNEPLGEKCLTSKNEKNNNNIKRFSAYKLKLINNKIKNGIEIGKNENDLKVQCLTDRTPRDIYSDIKKIKHFTDLKNKNRKLRAIKPPYFHILNENFLEKKSGKF